MHPICLVHLCVPEKERWRQNDREKRKRQSGGRGDSDSEPYHTRTESLSNNLILQTILVTYIKSTNIITPISTHIYSNT